MKTHFIPRCALLAALCLPVITVRADEVTLKNGSVIKGRIESIEDGLIVIKSEAFAVKADPKSDTISVRQSEVSSFSTDAPLFLNTVAQTVVTGKVEAQPAGNVRVVTPYGPATIAIDNLREGWLPGAPSPHDREMEKLKRHWEYTADFGLLGRTGNREEVGVSSGLQALLKSPEDETLFYAKHNYSKTKGDLGWVKSADNLHAGVEYTSYFARPAFWYVRSDNGYDRVRLINFFSTDAAGLGRLLIDKAEQHLSVRCGLSYRFEAYDDVTSREDTSTAGLDAGLHHDCKFKYFTMVNDVTYTPSFKDFNDCIVLHNSYIEMPLANTEMWKLRMGVTNEYRSHVAPGLKEIDTTYYVRFALSWK